MVSTTEVAPTFAKPVESEQLPPDANAPSSFVWVFPPVGGPSVVYELDFLVAFMLLTTLLHAASTSNGALALSSFGLGLFTENASLRFGGTHCHASGLLDFDQCSSCNSVLYYVPWVYSAVLSAERLVDKRSFAFPLLCGMLFFGMCGIYETQGPMMGWWLWPRSDGLVKPHATTWQLGDLGVDTRGLVTNAYVAEALGVRVYGVPSMAPFFHFAFGWGIACAFQDQSRFELRGGPIQTVILVPSLAMLCDPAVRIFEWTIGASKTSAVVVLMLSSFFGALLAGAPLTLAPKRDVLLFLAPCANGLFFFFNAFFGRGADVEPADLRMFVLAVAGCATLAYARAAGLLVRSEGEAGGGKAMV